MTDSKVVVTPTMVARAHEAHFSPGRSQFSDGRDPEVSPYAIGMAERLTKALNPGPWVVEDTTAGLVRLTRGSSLDDPDYVTLRVTINTSASAHSTDTPARQRMAEALADILNEADFKREDYV